MYVLTQSICYGIEELQAMIIKRERGTDYSPVVFSPSGKPMHEEDVLEIIGEVFVLDPETKLEGSNFGRVRLGDKILKQYQEEGKPKDWLCVDCSEGKKGIHVWRIIAGAWCMKRDGANTVHHINNNGFDNRPSNLIWVTKDEHDSIEIGIIRNN